MEHKTVSLADQVFERLENAILSGVYPRGEVLTELKLVNELGVSRTPIREAVQKLEQEHIVEVTQKGILVLGVTQQDLADIYTIRLRLEGLTAAGAAAHITPEQLRELKETVDLQEYYVSRRDVEHIREQDSRFHELIYSFSGSSVLYYTLLPLHKRIQKYRKTSLEDDKRAVQSLQEHKQVYAAIAAGDAAQAERAMVEHATNAMRKCLKSSGEVRVWD